MAAYAPIQTIVSRETAILNRLESFVTIQTDHVAFNSARISARFLEAINLHQQMHTQLGNLSYTLLYNINRVAPGARPATAILHEVSLEVSELDRRMARVADRLLQLTNSPNPNERLTLDFHQPSFGEIWHGKIVNAYRSCTNAISNCIVSPITGTANLVTSVYHECTGAFSNFVVSPIAGTIGFAYNHPWATAAGTTAFVAAGSLALCKPELASGVIQKVLPESMQNWVTVPLTNASNYFQHSCAEKTTAVAAAGICSNYMCTTSAVAAGLSATSMALGIRSSITTAFQAAGDGLRYAYEHPFRTAGKALRGVVWDLPVGACHGVTDTLDYGVRGIGGILNGVKSYARNALPLAPFVTAGVAYAANAYGASTATTAQLALATFSGHIILRGIHSTLNPPAPVPPPPAPHVIFQ